MRRSRHVTYALPTVMPPMLGAPRVEPALLPRAVRQALRRAGLVTIRRSEYASGRECPYRLKLQAGGATESFSAYALLGSVFARAMELQFASHATLQWTQQEWLGCFAAVRAAHPGQRYLYRGSEVQWSDCKDWTQAFLSGEPWGVPLGHIITRCCAELKARGYANVESELLLRLPLHGSERGDEVEATGTLDVAADFHGFPAIGDAKSSGLWDVILKEDGQIKAQSYDVGQIRYHEQLQNYQWLLWRVRNVLASFFVLIFPANVVPYRQKNKTGERGLLLQAAPAPTLAQVLDYERDYVNFWTSWTTAAGQYRARPGNFGRSSCPSCPVLQACFGDASVSSVASTLDTPDFSYLQAE